jgi:hypothetical protein
MGRRAVQIQRFHFGGWWRAKLILSMIISNLDLCRAANMLIERHGKEPSVEAAKMIDAMLDRGDLAGRAVWLRIKRAIAELQAGPISSPH